MTIPATQLLDLPPQVRGRVVVAMSGGVDSSVAAALAAEAGHDVVGLTLQLYDHGAAVRRKGACCAGQDIHDARRVADRLGIAHYVLDYESRFRNAVIEEFADAYAAGLTPVPCARCNERVKFADLLASARALGASALVTGHYVASREANGRRALYRARDGARDQSYFLFTTTQDQLDLLRFPLGEMEKHETRDIARRLDLPVADKPDSQDICFVPDGHYTSVVERLRPDAAEPGDIVDLDGRVLGRHGGIMRYTVGQRRGLGIATGEPLFVVSIDAARRQVVVGPREALVIDRLKLGDVNWIGEGTAGELAGRTLDVFVKVRSTRPPVPARLVLGDGGCEVELKVAEEGVSPGQACVFYDSDREMSRVLGGGWIAQASARGAPARADAEAAA